ncbi:MAG: 30S ribosomal protein S6 [Verrucomicrobiota bacterium]|nr:30S ribosomal protein S6 [Verrucomicrobiota bacterium]
MKKYDALLILPGSLKDEALDSALKAVENEVTKLRGRVVDSRRVGTRTFSRPLGKLDSGHYVRMALELEPKAVAALHGRLKLNENVFRAQIVVAQKKKVAAVPAERKEEGVGNGKS